MVKKINILVLGTKEYPMYTNQGEDKISSGGIETFVQGFTKSLESDNQINLKIITRKFKTTPSYEQHNNIETYRVRWLSGFWLRNPTFNTLAFFKALTLKCDMIISNGVIATLMANILGRIKGVPVIAIPHGIAHVQPQYKPRIQKILKILEEEAYSSAEKVIALSEEEKIRLTNFRTILQSRIRVIPQAVDFDKFNFTEQEKRDNLKQTLNISPNDTVITFLGRLSPVKGINYLIEAVHKLKQQGISNYKLVIVGDGTEREALFKQAYNLFKEETNKQILFIQFTDAVPQLLSITDIFVLPSLSEGMPVALLEAFASKKQCVVTDIGLPITDKQAKIVPPKDADALAQAISSLIQHPQPQLAEEAYNFAKSRSWKSTITTWKQEILSSL